MYRVTKGILVSVFVVMLTACGGGSAGSGAGDPVKSVPTAVEKIANYAKDGGTAPTVQMYVDAGITGVTSSNLAEFNVLVAGLSYEDVNTKVELQALADDLVGVEVDTIAPVITITGANPQTIELGSAYAELGASADDGSAVIIGTSDVKNNTVGSYEVTYNATDTSGNIALQVTRIVNVKDTVAPVITLTGANPQTIELGSAYVELNASTADGSTVIIDSSTVKITTVGIYIVSYNAADVSGNVASEVIRTINVTDSTAPVITLTGVNPQTIELGSVYVELNASTADGGTVVIDSSTVKTSTVGTYTVTYNATDASENVASEVTRTINVTDTVALIFTSEANVTVAENQRAALTLVATGASTYSIAGADSDDFDVNVSTGVVAFKTAPDFETVATYSFTATATDDSANAVSQTVTIYILDVSEGQRQALKKTGQTTSYYTKDDGDYQKGTTPSYTRDDMTNIVTDHVTGLEWQDTAETLTMKKNWADAQSYCSTLSLDGSGWRLPTRKELVSLIDYGKTKPAINPTFSNVVTYSYWSSTTNAGYSNYAWYVFFTSGYQSTSKKSANDYIRCVRVGQP